LRHFVERRRVSQADQFEGFARGLADSWLVGQQLLPEKIFEKFRIIFGVYFS
jgi:hypothetical protein